MIEAPGVKEEATGDNFEIFKSLVLLCSQGLEMKGSAVPKKEASILLWAWKFRLGRKRLNNGGTLLLLMLSGQALKSPTTSSGENGESLVAGVPRRDSMPSEVYGLSEAFTCSANGAIARVQVINEV